MYQTTELRNGITVLTHTMKRAYSVSVGVWIKVGARYEQAPASGISHLLEHMVFKGSKHYDGKTIKRQIEGRGGSLNGFTSEEVTCYLAKAPASIARDSLRILLDMALQPCLRSHDLERERTVIIEEIKMYNDLPQHMAQELLDGLMWPQHALGRNIAGSVESVSSISRESLVRFQKQYYSPHNIIVVFAGNIDHKACCRLVASGSGKRSKQGVVEQFESFASQQQKPTIKAIAKGIEQTRLALGFHAYSRTHPKRFILTLLSIILGGNMSSRLFDKVREKQGLAYAIAAHYKRLIDTGALLIVAGLDNQKIDLAFEVIIQELAQLKKRLVGDAELRRAKDFFIGQLAMGLEDTLEHMVYAGESLVTTGAVQGFSELSKAVERVTPAQIREVAQEVFVSDQLNCAVVGPIEGFRSERWLDCLNRTLK